MDDLAVRARATMRRQMAAAAAAARKDANDTDEEEENTSNSTYEAASAPSLQVDIEAFSRELVAYEPFAVVKMVKR